MDPTQVYTTGDMVQPTIYGSGVSSWTNGVYQDSLTCWGWGNPGYCGPNAIVRPDNNINFSYGTTDLYQSHSIANFLPSNGNGLRVNGYNFGFTAKNGNGWDDGRVDYLNAYTRFTDSNGNIVYSKIYDLNYKFDWTTFNFSETFSTPYSAKSLGNVTYGFIGRDNNFWAGPYGPEINNISFSLKYSVDPCFVNALSSPTCPGYIEAISKLNTPKIEPLIIVTPTVQSTTSTEPILSSTTPASTATTSTVSVAPVVTNNASSPQSSSSPGAPVSLSTILGIVRAEQSRIGSVEATAVQQANETALQAVNQASALAESVAAKAVQQSQTTANQLTTTTSAQTVSLTLTTTNNVLGGVGLRLPQFSPGGNETGYSINSENELPKLDGLQLTGQSPLKDYLEEKPTQTIEGTERTNQNPQVRRPIADNELGTGGTATLTAMNRLPVGFDSYLGIIKDVPFYPPKEIYRNQRTVENDAVRRRLFGGSDYLHQQMVDQQYNQGK